MQYYIKKSNTNPEVRKMTDIKMLQLVMKNAEMGCRGINNIKHYSNSDEMTKALKTQNLEYGKIYNNARNMLKRRGGHTKHVSHASAVMAKIVTKREMNKDDSNSHIAEMMIQGNTMGVQKIAKNIRQYGKQNSNITKLANKLMSTQQANIEEMKHFL